MEFSIESGKLLSYFVTVFLAFIFPYVIKLLQVKIKESTIVKELTHNENLNTLVNDALCEVMNAVQYVNQIYVDTLKARGEFTEEAQREAFNRAYAEAAIMISDASREAVMQLHGSFENWLKSKIEVAVNEAKK